MGKTDNKAAELEQALREIRDKEEFNFALFQHNPAAITVVDAEGRVVKSNLARRHWKEPLPALGSPLFSLSDEYDRDMQQELLACIKRRKVRDFPEVRYGERHLAITIAPFPEGAIVISHDITDRKRAEEEARSQQEQLIQAQKMAALGTMVSGVAHEVSNPNNVMLLNSRALSRLMEALLPVLDRYCELEGDFAVGSRPYSEMRGEIPQLVDTTARAAERIRSFVNDLKTFARKDESKPDGDVDVNAAVTDAVTLLGPVIRKATAAFTLECADSLPEVAGREQQIEQVVINLVTNACQALTDRSAPISVRTWLDTRKRQVAIEVKDGGVGIPPDLLSRVTDPFFTTKRDTGGTGLGLAISNKIVRSHGGTLEFRSKPGNGATATIRLPVPRPRKPKNGDANR